MPHLGRTVVSLLVACGLVAPAAAAPTPPVSSDDRPASPTEAPPSTAPGEKAASAQNQALAKKEYAEGYKEAQAGKKAAAGGKTAEATRKFAKALERFEEAVRLDEAYADAWNMIGFCARHVGDMKRSFDAYDRALAIDPDHEEAHEYLGEAYLAIGNIEKAKEQLAWLRAKGSEEAEELAEAIENAAPSTDGETADDASEPSGAAADSSAAH